MNTAHKECIDLLSIVHNLCKSCGVKYTISANTLILYENNIDFESNAPIIHIACAYPQYLILKDKLLAFCNQNKDYSFHDYSNTDQFETFEAWFVKEGKMEFSDARKKESFYYGTRLIITPLFYVGDYEKDWNIAYRYFENTLATVNSRAVLKGKPLRSYIRLSRKRRISNYYIKQRGIYTIEKTIEKYGQHKKSKYVVYPYLVNRNRKNPNSLPWIVNAESKKITEDIWDEIKEVNFYGTQCYICKNSKEIIDCYPDYYIENVSKTNELISKGNTYLWQIQRIQIELLREFDRICRKYNLKYNISFGTLLGAVRHSGFIPWDDDIDVTMPWEDFDKLDSIMQKELDEKVYYYRCPQNEENNHLIFKHLERKGTLYTKPGREKLQHQIGVFIDIFPMYPSAPLKVLDFVHAKICRYWRTALWATVGAASEKDEKLRARYEKMALPGNKKCYEKFVRVATFFENKKYLKFWIAMDRNPYKVSLVKMSNYTDAIELEFEGYKFLAPRNYEEVLTYCFGEDWKMYPSVRGRMPSHNANVEIGNLYKIESEDMI